METLKFLLQSKHADATTPGEVVREAVEWVQGQLRNAGVPFQYVPVGSGIGCYGVIQVRPTGPGANLLLDLRIAEIKGVPYVSAEVRQSHDGSVCFPYFGEIGGSDGRDTLLNFIADFVLSTFGQG